MYQHMGFVESYLVLGSIALFFTVISFITLDSSRVLLNRTVLEK